MTPTVSQTYSPTRLKMCLPARSIVNRTANILFVTMTLMNFYFLVQYSKGRSELFQDDNGSVAPYSADSHLVSIDGNVVKKSSLRHRSYRRVGSEVNVRGHSMCACGRCYDVQMGFNRTGYLIINITRLKEPILDKNHVGELSYFFVRVRGPDIALATLASDGDIRLAALDQIHVTSRGVHDITVTLIHTSKSSAYGLDTAQMKELRCPLRLRNKTYHVLIEADIMNVTDGKIIGTTSTGTQFKWVPVKPGEVEISRKQPCLLYGGLGYSFHEDGSDKDLLYYCYGTTCVLTKRLQRCLREKKFLVIGDSHVFLIGERLKENGTLLDSGWRFMFHGLGIYHNVSPDRNMTAYMLGDAPGIYEPGKILELSQKDGYYERLQTKERFDGIVISSGHWDLRDISVDLYLTHLEELFARWKRFQEVFGIPLYWNGIPPYSFGRGMMGFKERRTNVKIALADLRTKELCTKYNVTFIPYFDIAFPFYTMSCDCHHYLCRELSSPIGEAQMNVFLRTICES